MAWSLGSASPNSVEQSAVASGVLTVAFASNVTAGDVIVACSQIDDNGNSKNVTFSDTSGNVTTWNSSKFYLLSSLFRNLAIGWGVATTTGPCTPKATWATATDPVTGGLYIGDFTPPSGTVSADGALATANTTTGSATVTTPSGNGTGASDLLINLIYGSNPMTFNAPWTALAAGGTQAVVGYALNAAGNSAANATQNSSAAYGSIILALQTPGGGSIALPPLRQQTNWAAVQRSLR